MSTASRYYLIGVGIAAVGLMGAVAIASTVDTDNEPATTEALTIEEVARMGVGNLTGDQRVALCADLDDNPQLVYGMLLSGLEPVHGFTTEELADATLARLGEVC